eukprot:s7507_g3.t1
MPRLDCERRRDCLGAESLSALSLPGGLLHGPLHAPSPKAVHAVLRQHGPGSQGGRDRDLGARLGQLPGIRQGMGDAARHGAPAVRSVGALRFLYAGDGQRR